MGVSGGRQVVVGGCERSQLSIMSFLRTADDKA